MADSEPSRCRAEQEVFLCQMMPTPRELVRTLLLQGPTRADVCKTCRRKAILSVTGSMGVWRQPCICVSVLQCNRQPTEMSQTVIAFVSIVCVGAAMQSIKSGRV